MKQIACTMDLLLFSLLVLTSGCARDESTSRNVEAIRISSMTNIYSESLAALSNKSAFKAEIIGAKVQESSNLFTNEGRIVTNHYFIWLRSAEGSERILRGLNVPAAELSRVKQLEEGKSYIFPNALLE